MKLLTLLYVFCLFYVFIPGNVIKLPIKTSNTNIILIHAFVFSVILSCTYGLVDHVNLIEGHSDKDKVQLRKEIEEKKKQGKNLEDNKREDEDKEGNKKRDIRKLGKQMQEDDVRMGRKKDDIKKLESDLRR